MRSAKDDLATCDKATPGPWYRKKKGTTLCGVSVEGEIADTGPFDGFDCGVYAERMGTYPFDDANFIAAAREALPYWIKRAEKLEWFILRAYAAGCEDETANVLHDAERYIREETSHETS